MRVEEVKVTLVVFDLKVAMADLKQIPNVEFLRSHIHIEFDYPKGRICHPRKTAGYIFGKQNTQDGNSWTWPSLPFQKLGLSLNRQSKHPSIRITF